MSMEDVEQELWRRYRDDNDLAARDYLFLKYASWARHVAGKVVGRVPSHGMEWMDHVQNAQIGLLEAMARFDQRRGVDFMAYAKPRVRGAVFNGIRGFVHPQSSRADDRHVGDRLGSLWDSDASDDPVDNFVDAVVGLSLGFFLEGRSSQEEVDSLQMSQLLRDGLLDLPSRQRQILIAHYFQHVQFQKIAEDLAITKGRVSQLHKAALSTLRKVLALRRAHRDSFF